MVQINTDLPEYISANYITRLIDKINEVGKDSELSWLSYGGNVWAGQTFIDFLNNVKFKVDANVTGIAASMGAVILPFFNKTKTAFQADFMIHSVGGNDNNVDSTNNFLYESLAKKINEIKFEEITGHKLKTVMLAKGDSRFDVWFTGKDAVNFGLVDEGYDLLIKENSVNIPKSNLGYDIPESILEKYNKKFNINKNKNNMNLKDVTINQLKKENRAVYDSIFEIGKVAETERTSQILKYASHDLEEANIIIKSGKQITLEQVAELTAKKANLEKVANLENDSEEDFNPAKPIVEKTATKLTEKEAALKIEKEAAKKELNEILGIEEFED